jgi:hypothetical protein
MTNRIRSIVIVAVLAASSVLVDVALSLWMHGLIISDDPPAQGQLSGIGWATKLISAAVLLLLLRPGVKWSLVAVPVYLVAITLLGLAASLAVLGRYGIGL